MRDIHSELRAIRRPRLLVSAARFGLRGYDRDAALGRIFGAGAVPGPGEVFVQLAEIEGALEAERRRGGAVYSVARHVETLVALMAESRTLSLVA